MSPRAGTDVAPRVAVAGTRVRLKPADAARLPETAETAEIADGPGRLGETGVPAPSPAAAVPSRRLGATVPGGPSAAGGGRRSPAGAGAGAGAAVAVAVAPLANPEVPCPVAGDTDVRRLGEPALAPRPVADAGT
ncbi:hypothetical protein CA983_36405, partial [Streptomyces swartbergensis]